MFRTVPLSIIRSFALYTQQWYMSYSKLSANLHGPQNVKFEINFVFLLFFFSFTARAKTVPIFGQIQRHWTKPR